MESLRGPWARHGGMPQPGRQTWPGTRGIGCLSLWCWPPSQRQLLMRSRSSHVDFEVEEEESCAVVEDAEEEAVAKEGARGEGSCPVGHLQRNLGCLLPSDSRPPTYAAGLGQTGETRSFRELDLVDPSASTLVGGQRQRGGPLRGRPLAVTAEGDPAGPGGGPCRGGGRGEGRWPGWLGQARGGEEAEEAKEALPGLPVLPWPGVQSQQVVPPALGAANSGN